MLQARTATLDPARGRRNGAGYRRARFLALDFALDLGLDLEDVLLQVLFAVSLTMQARMTTKKDAKASDTSHLVRVRGL